MPADIQTARRELSELMHSLSGRRVAPEALELIASGASGRCILRFPKELRRIGIYWTNDRADNASFPDAARGLQNAGIPVPFFSIEARLGSGCGACIVEDLGDASLLSMKERPWEERRAAYARVFTSLRAFHRVEPNWPLQAPFDAALYRWEQGYFAEHLLGRHLGLNAEEWLAHPALAEMADWLSAQERVPVHRDCQSQNIIFRREEACFIDFQGMRMGLAEYDLASLVYDPYMALQPAEAEELLRDWEAICGRPLHLPVFYACAMQRLMQALGAFANIGHNQHRDWYLKLIPTGLDSLRRVAREALRHEPTAPTATCLLTVM